MIMINVMVLTVAAFCAGYGQSDRHSAWRMFVYWASVGLNLGFIVLYAIRHP